MVLRSMVTDPNVPPLPPHVSMHQMRNYLGTVLRRATDARAVIKARAKESWAGAFPETTAH